MGCKGWKGSQGAWPFRTGRWSARLHGWCRPLLSPFWRFLSVENTHTHTQNDSISARPCFPPTSALQPPFHPHCLLSSIASVCPVLTTCSILQASWKTNCRCYAEWFLKTLSLHWTSKRTPQKGRIKVSTWQKGVGSRIDNLSIIINHHQ